MKTMNFGQSALACLSIILPAACARPDGGTTDTVGVRSTPASTIPADSPASRKTPDSSAWVVNERGIDSLRAGMTVAEARSALPSFKMRPGAESTGCDYARVDGVPAGLKIMVEDGRVGRIEVTEGDIATSTGARIGDSENTIKKLYPRQVTVTPHKYTDGHYLVVIPKSPSDSAFRIIFETDGTRVLRYRAGIRPQVEYVEGCA